MGMVGGLTNLAHRGASLCLTSRHGVPIVDSPLGSGAIREIEGFNGHLVDSTGSGRFDGRPSLGSGSKDRAGTGSGRSRRRGAVESGTGRL